jgi:hypothetical protein
LQRLIGIILLLAVAAVGSGALRYVHELDHAARDARAAHAGEPKPTVPHDESNCFVHAQLNLPMLQTGYVAVLVCLGVFVTFLTLLSTPVRSRRPVVRLDSRGPPRFAFVHVV